jgi:hypothetical protein
MVFAYFAFFAFQLTVHGPRIDETNGNEHANERLAPAMSLSLHASVVNG